MIFRSSLLIFFCILTGCAARNPSTTTGTVADSVKSTHRLPERIRFSFYMSGSGGPKKPSDSWTMDTTGLMAVKAITPDSPGHWSTVNALAQLDPPDYDSLEMFVRKGKLWTIDSSDIDQQCPGDELYNIIIAPMTDTVHLRATFHACAQEYNLLLEPQRTQFVRLIQWFERMRVKYRPVQP